MTLQEAAKIALASMPAEPPSAGYRGDPVGAHRRVTAALEALASGSIDQRHVGAIKTYAWDMIVAVCCASVAVAWSSPYLALEAVVKAFDVMNEGGSDGETS